MDRQSEQCLKLRRQSPTQHRDIAYYCLDLILFANALTNTSEAKDTIAIRFYLRAKRGVTDLQPRGREAAQSQAHAAEYRTPTI